MPKKSDILFEEKEVEGQRVFGYEISEKENETACDDKYTHIMVFAEGVHRAEDGFIMSFIALNHTSCSSGGL
ncbi:hypothetical protein Q3G72_029795 [Acer saccharum]|nr:hypothetical protein Q3G72_029795 [Acer saccharum]